MSTQTALIVIDVQSCFTEPAGAFDHAAEAGNVGAYYRRVDDTVIPNLQKLLTGFRGAGLPVYFTEMGSLRADGADLPGYARRANEASIAETGRVVFPVLDDPSARTDDRVKPAPGEIVIRKTTTGTLASSPLAQNLRSMGCTHVVVGGVVTDCCVHQTSRELADQDFDVTIVEDACATYVEEHHRAALQIFENFYGTVSDTSRVLSAL